MPEALEKKIRADAKRKRFKGKKADVSGYGPPKKTGFKPATSSTYDPKTPAKIWK